MYVLCIMINHLCDICIYILCIVNILYFSVIPSLSLTWYLHLELSRWCHTYFSHAADSHVSSIHYFMYFLTVYFSTFSYAFTLLLIQSHHLTSNSLCIYSTLFSPLSMNKKCDTVLCVMVTKISRCYVPYARPLI